MFTEESGVTSGAPFSLATLPVHLHLQHDADLLSYIQGFSDDLSKVTKNLFNRLMAIKDIGSVEQMSHIISCCR